MTYDVGQVGEIRLEVRDASTGQLTDATVVATVTTPSGVDSTPTVEHDTTGIYLFSVALTEPGLTRWRADITGAVQDVQDGSLYAVEPGTDVGWEPTLEIVAAYVPTRTIEVGDLTGQPCGTFTTLTTPTGGQVTSMIAESVGWVASAAGATVDPALYDLASAAAALRAAAWVESAQPMEVRDQARVDSLIRQADDALARVVTANAAMGHATVPTTDAALPVWGYPDPVTWGDDLLL